MEPWWWEPAGKAAVMAGLFILAGILGQISKLIWPDEM